MIVLYNHDLVSVKVGMSQLVEHLLKSFGQLNERLLQGRD